MWSRVQKAQFLNLHSWVSNDNVNMEEAPGRNGFYSGSRRWNG
ncbi:hypothetical protein [Chengkuizengella axinellae]|uniref:Uncharacterized protein n=1 Tax=Chengkuizengella axinellae TaxID=3064388 RepID=A0ABT9IW09_9BACL|nr:hypothetical protein [Chengkuizengella sp. 2205SS18-9]MDP5273559.1 hypothetical protein [Chengkuizengella sp. 2205SS18-9]